jgi:NAD(P)-dependent dehydrogenase (short-subunit alcohol dehydrogenase family)
VALAFAREGADVLISYLSEEADARRPPGWSRPPAEMRRRRGRHQRGGPLPGDHRPGGEEFGKVDILVNNAAFQMTREDISEISTEEFDRTLKTNLYAMFWLTRAAVPHMPAGGSVINTSSIQADSPSPELCPTR